MKTLLISLILCVSFSSAFSQLQRIEIEPGTKVLKYEAGKKHEPPADFDYKGIFPKVISSKDKSCKPHNDTAFKETITTYYDRSSRFISYYYSDFWGWSYPVTGTNSEYHFLGIEYDFTPNDEEPVYLHSFLIAYNEINISGSPDEVWTMVCSGDENGDPEKFLLHDYALYTLGDVIPNKQEPVFHEVIMSQPLEMCGNFLIYVCTTGIDPDNPGSNVDEVWLWSNVDGDGCKEFRCNTMSQENGKLYWCSLEDFFYFDGIDIDVMIMPVIANEEGLNTGVSYKINGMSIDGIFPNPVKDIAYLKFSLEVASDVKIDLIGQEGRIICTVYDRFLQSGSHNIPIDLSGMSSGNYFFAIKTNKGRTAMKCTVLK